MMRDKASQTSIFSTSFVLCFFLFMFFFFSLFTRGVPPNGDPVSYFVLAENIVDRGSIAFEPSSTVPLEKGSGGKFYSKFAPGQSLLEVPFYAAARAVEPDGDAVYKRTFRYFISELSSSLAAALACAFILLIAAELGCCRVASLATALSFALCSMIWPYSKIGFSESLQACLIAAAIYFALKSSGGKTAIYSALCAVALGILMLTKTVMAIVAPAFFIFLLASPCPGGGTIRRRGIPFVFTLVVFAALALCYNYARFGDLLKFGYDSGKDAAFGFTTPMLVGLYGLLFSPGKSVFLYAPIVFLSIAAFPALRRQRPDVAALALWSCAIVIAVFAKWWAWHGDWSWGPRFMVPLMPFAMLPVAEFFRDFKNRSRMAKSAACLILAMSLTVQLLSVSVNFFEHIMIVNHQVKINAFFMPGRPDLRDDLLYLHFVSDFSPVAGQWWLFRHTVAARNGDAAAQAEEMKQDFPWKGLMRFAVPSNPGRGIGFDFWWRRFPEFFPQSGDWASALLMTMLAGCAISLIFCAALFRKDIQSDL